VSTFCGTSPSSEPWGWHVNSREQKKAPVCNVLLGPPNEETVSTSAPITNPVHVKEKGP